MKFFTKLSIFACTLFLLSCQNESVNNEITEESNLIDKNYVDDLESFKNTSIVVNETSYSIEEVLTNADLFNVYENAYTYHFAYNMDRNTEVMYILEDSESADRLFDEIKSKTAIAKNNAANKNAGDMYVDLFFKIHNKANYSGSNWSYSMEGTATDAVVGETTEIRIPYKKRNMANSISVDNDTTNEGTLKLRFYEDINSGGDFYSTLQSKSSLYSTDVGNNNIASAAIYATSSVWNTNPEWTKN